mgnify:CR=1 FL=1
MFVNVELAPGECVARTSATGYPAPALAHEDRSENHLSNRHNTGIAANTRRLLLFFVPDYLVFC